MPWSAAYSAPAVDPYHRTAAEEVALDALIEQRGDRTVAQWVRDEVSAPQGDVACDVDAMVAARRREFAIVHDRRGEEIPWVGEVKEELPAWHEGGSTAVHDLVPAAGKEVDTAVLWDVWADACDIEANPVGTVGHRTPYTPKRTIEDVKAWYAGKIAEAS